MKYVSTTAAVALSLALLIQTPTTAHQSKSGQAALDQSRGDAINNPEFKGPEVLAFFGVKRGDYVVDLIAGRFTQALSEKVGPEGKVYAVEPTEVVKVHPQVLTIMKGLAAQARNHNVEVITGAINQLMLPQNVDAVMIRQNYHDLHDKFMGPADVAAFNRRVYAALKPGGVLMVLDHAASSGSGLRDTDTLHRIDPLSVRTEVTSAGFIFDSESSVLANPSDPRDKNVFDPSIRGRTDQFIFRFRKPA